MAFHYLGGVFSRLRYDNLPSAVKRILRGFQREEAARFVAFRSHWRYQSEFCNPGEGHEKGGVEHEVGTFRILAGMCRSIALIAILCSIPEDKPQTLIGSPKAEAQSSGASSIQHDRSAALKRAAFPRPMALCSVGRSSAVSCVLVPLRGYILDQMLPPCDTIV